MGHAMARTVFWRGLRGTNEVSVRAIPVLRGYRETFPNGGNVISKKQADDIRSRNETLNAWVDTIRGKNGWASYRQEDKPAHVPDVSNEERSSLEVFEFVQNPPDKYFLYISEENQTATTWTGDKLGHVLFGREWRDSFGGRRVPVTVRAINGVTYHGTYFKSTGNYARIKRAKS